MSKSRKLRLSLANEKYQSGVEAFLDVSAQVFDGDEESEEEDGQDRKWL